MISTVAHTVLYVSTTILIILAICITTIRWYPNLSDIVEEKIEVRLGEILNADVSIESLDVSRHKLFSEIVAQNVKIIDRDNVENVWELKKARISVDLSRSLLTLSVRVREVTLEGMDLSVKRNESGDFQINQAFLLPKNKVSLGGVSGKNKYANVHLGLMDSNVHWIDELTNTNYLFQELDIAIEPTSRGYDVFVSGNLPPSLGKSLQAYLQFEGDVNNLAEAKLDFYLKTEQFRLAEVAKRIVGKEGEKVPVVIDSEVWGQVANKTLVGLRGTAKAQNIVVNPGHAKSELCLSDEYIQQLSMQFDWQNIDRNWKLLVNELEVVTSKRDWPKSEAQFKLERHSLNGKSIFAHIGSMNLGAICNTLHAYSPHIVRFEDQLKQYRFNAGVEDLFIRFDLAENHQSSFQYSAQFSDATLWQAQGNRLVSGVSGFIEGGDAGGKALLDSAEITVSLPEQYPGFDLKFAVNGELLWTHQGDVYEVHSDKLKIHNNDFQMSARVDAKLMGENLYTDSQIHISSANANAVGDYFPLFVKTRTTKKWFTEAIHKGDISDATILLRGNMRAFPFHKQAGVFQTQVNVENGVLEYKKDWPQLEEVQAKVLIDKDQINITSQHATTLNSKVKKVDIKIESFLRSILQLRGTVDGPGQDLLQFLGDASLVRKTNSVLDQISLAGDSRLEVNFSRSLSKKVDYPARVSGNIHFLGNTLDIKKVGIELKDLAGEVAFDAQGATGEGLTATVYGQPIDLSMQPSGEGASRVFFKGPFDLSAYLQQRSSRFIPYFSGITSVDGELYLPSLFKKDNPDKLKLKINSELKGVKAELPTPLDKQRDQALPASIAYDQKQGTISWHLSDLLALHFSLKPQQPFALRMIELGSSDDSLSETILNNEGMTITGSWDTVAPDLWLATSSIAGINCI